MRNFIFITICLLLSACEEVVNRPLVTEDSDLIVVEAILTNEKKMHLVKLSHPYKTQNETSEPVTGATVIITEGSNVYPLTELPIGSGKYHTPEFRAVLGSVYTLSIKYKEKEYLAQDSAVPVEPLRKLKYKKVKDHYELFLFKTGEDPYFIDHTINWETTDACTEATTCKGRIVYYDLKTIDVNEIYKPDEQDFGFPLNTVIIRRKYSVSHAYKMFLRSVLSETEWRGGVFDVQRDNVQTNLSEGAVGFFAVTTVISDTTIVN